ncbi:MAG: ribonuclease PH [Candidatus Gastranaerophilales bacterium]|nr:ribonuclease PH [Candidatus Gastranaerophilales bacterium]
MTRNDGRANDETRNINFTLDYTKNALASVLVEFGNTKVIVTATNDDKKPKWMEKEDTRGWVTAEYSLLPTATSTRCQRERSKVSGRTQEIQRLIGRALRSCVNLEKLGERTMIIDADVIQADGGTRCASICGGYVALSLAISRMMKDGLLEENPIIEPIAAVSAGISGGEVILDLNYEEDSSAQVDSNAVMTKSGKVIEFQTTAEGEPYDIETMNKIVELSKNAIQKIISLYPKTEVK